MDYNKESLKLHRKYKGKLGIETPFSIENKDDLSIAYTPGVAEPCRAIAKNKEEVWNLTIKSHMVAVVTDGSAVLGLGNIGPEASIPVMEGKANLFKRFGGIDAMPIALDTLEVDEIVETVKRIAPVFGGINLEDISAPRCFEVERRLIEELEIPVMHDDQHGTAVVILAGLINALKVVGKKMENLKVVINGAGSAGIAAANLLSKIGVPEIIMLDSKGIIAKGRDNLNAYKEEVMRYNVNNIRGALKDAIQGADVFIGVSVPNVLTPEMVSTMAKDSIVFAMANPTPEIMPDIAKSAGVAVVATGRSDFPNQVNNVLAFPGIFKGALEARVNKITDDMKIAAAKTIASIIKEPTADLIIPSPFEEGIADAVSEAVKSAIV